MYMRPPRTHPLGWLRRAIRHRLLATAGRPAPTWTRTRPALDPNLDLREQFCPARPSHGRSYVRHHGFWYPQYVSRQPVTRGAAAPRVAVITMADWCPPHLPPHSRHLARLCAGVWLPTSDPVVRALVQLVPPACRYVCCSARPRTGAPRSRMLAVRCATAGLMDCSAGWLAA